MTRRAHCPKAALAPVDGCAARALTHAPFGSTWAATASSLSATVVSQEGMAALDR